MSDLLARLIQAGTPADLVGEVAMLMAEQKILERRRASERERKAKQRSNDLDGHVTSRDITGQGGTSQDNPSLSLPPNENNSNPPTHTHPESISPRARKAEPFPKPDWAETQVWADLKANRKAKRLPNTPTAYTKFLRDFEQWVTPDWPPGRVLEAIVARGWASAQYDPREGQSHGRPTHPNIHQSASPRGSRPNPCLDMLLQAEAEIRAAEYPGHDFDAGPPLRAIR